MSARSGGSIQYWLLLLLLPTLLLAQDDCSHNYKNEANRYYYVRPEGSAETLCPAQPCLTPSQLREHFSECERNNSCQTANTSIVLLQGNYTLASNHGSFIPQLEFLSLTGCNEDCNTDSLATPSIDCNGTSISLMFQHIECLHVRNCVVFTGHDTTVEVDRVTFHDSLIRLASITAADHSELDYNYTLGSQSYCLLQKQLADINALTPSHSVLALRNVSFSSEYHTVCAREHGIQLTTIHATDSALGIADCMFTQNAVTHISLLHSSLNTSGMVQFERANTAIAVNSSTVTLAGVVNFFNNNNSAIQALDSIIVLAGTVEFTNNTSVNGGAISMTKANLTIADNSFSVFLGNHAKDNGGAIASSQHVTIAGSVQFINNSAGYGGAIHSYGNVIITDNAQYVLFQGNHAIHLGGASSQHVTIAGSVKFIDNSADKGGAITCYGNVTITDNAQVVGFQGNHARDIGGAMYCDGVTIAGSVQFINNSADWGGAITCLYGNVTITDNAQYVLFQGNNARDFGGAIYSLQHITIAGSVKFINNSADWGGAIICYGNVTITDNAQDVGFQGNNARDFGGAIASSQHVTIAGSVQFINNSADHGGAIDSTGGHDVTITDTARVVFQSNRADYGGAIASNGVIIKATKVYFQGNQAESAGGAIVVFSNVELAGSVQFINNTALLGGAIAMIEWPLTVAKNARVIFGGNRAHHVGGAIYSTTSSIVYSISQHNQPCSISFGNNSKLSFFNNTAKRGGSAMYGIIMSKMVCVTVTTAHRDYEYLSDIIKINPDNFSAVSSDPLRVCICPDQSTPDCLAILPTKHTPPPHCLSWSKLHHPCSCSRLQLCSHQWICLCSISQFRCIPGIRVSVCAGSQSQRVLSTTVQRFDR